MSARHRQNDVMEALDEIRNHAKDYDGNAHGLEDALHQGVLRSIADGAANAPELARLALESRAIEFERWYE